MTTVRATRFVDCPFSAVIEFAEQALRDRPDIAVSPAPGVAEPVHVAARVADDVSDTVRRHDALLLAWQPAIPALFPDFRGVLTVRPKGRGAWLRIQGSYEPPLGAFGRLFDSIAGRHIAWLTIARLTHQIARDVQRRWRAFRTEITV